MKKIYIKPETELHKVQQQGFLAGSNSENIPVGETPGKFDTKKDNSDWNMWDDEE